jgi:hypothetical protein
MAHADGMPDCGGVFPRPSSLRPSGADVLIRRMNELTKFIPPRRTNLIGPSTLQFYAILLASPRSPPFFLILPHLLLQGWIGRRLFVAAFLRRSVTQI